MIPDYVVSAVAMALGAFILVAPQLAAKMGGRTSLTHWHQTAGFPL